MSENKTKAIAHPSSQFTKISQNCLKALFLVIMLICFVQEIKAQEIGTRRQTVYAEFLGNGGFLTVNYDTRLNVDRNDGLGVRVGIGFGSFFFLNPYTNWVNAIKSGTQYISVPLQLNYIVGKKRSGLEAGVGITQEFTFNQKGNDPRVQLTGLLNLGYRLQPRDRGFSFRILASPGIYQGKIFPIGAGISLGYSFK